MTSDTPVRCVVVGAQGFLGARIVTEFLDAGYSVIGVDRGPLREASPVMPDTYRHCQISLPSPDLAELVFEHRPQVVVNAAGPASVADSMTDPRSDFDGTIGVLLDVLEAVRRAGTNSRVVTMSSAAVYGNPVALPVGEDAALVPVSPYGFHKQVAEMLLREYFTVYGVPSCAARVFSAYGPGLRRQLLWDVCRKAINGSVELFGTGNETRDFIHVADVARAVRVLAERAPMRAEAYNVASGVQTPVSVLARTLVSSVFPDMEVRFSGEQRPGDPLYWQADISAISKLGFIPRVSLEDGAREYAAWCLAEAGK